MQAGGNMETLKSRGRAVVGKGIRRVFRATGMHLEIARLEDRLAAQDGRIAQLERELQESRRLNQRLAELTDVVTEVLVPAADREDEKIRQILATYNRDSF
jgi:uncharacterized coiled-coil protein SlyX